MARRVFASAISLAALGLFAGTHRPRGEEGPARFVGAQACAPCHPAVHQAWSSSRHSKMVQPASGESVQGDFGAGSITLRGERYRLRVEAGRFYVSESRFTGREVEHRVDYTLGNRRIQHYLTTLEDGRIIVLPPTWDVLRRQWFHNLEIVAADESDPGIVQLWNKNCFGCHVSEEEKNYDPGARTYRTRWRDFGTSCERCHGPGSRHVARYRDADLYGGDPESEIVVPTRLDPATSTMACAQCHSLRDTYAEGFTAGESYYDYFLPLLEYSQAESADPSWWPDGRTRRFSSNALGIWQSDCFLEGGVACTDCHRDAHVPEIEKNAQLRPANNELCTRCHAEIGEAVPLHTRHAEGSPGSSCVECHMPRTVTSIKATMRDHAISVPVPENTIRHGIPNACNVCHEDRSPAWAIEHLESWFPKSRSRQKLIRRASAYSGARNGDPGSIDDLVAIAEDEREGPLPRANALGHLSRFTDPRVSGVLLRALEDRHPLVRATAALKLGQLEGIDPNPARKALLRQLSDPRRIVRMNASMSLLNLRVHRLEGEAGRLFEAAKQDHIDRARLHEDDAPSQLNMGTFYLLSRDADSAARAFEAALHLDPRIPGGKYFLALAALARDRAGEARQLLNQIDPDDPYARPARDLLRKIQ